MNMKDRWHVKFPGGYTATVFAESADEAKTEALRELIRRGHSIDPRTDVNAERITVNKLGQV